MKFSRVNPTKKNHRKKRNRQIGKRLVRSEMRLVAQDRQGSLKGWKERGGSQGKSWHFDLGHLDLDGNEDVKRSVSCREVAIEREVKRMLESGDSPRRGCQVGNPELKWAHYLRASERSEGIKDIIERMKGQVKERMPLNAKRRMAM